MKGLYDKIISNSNIKRRLDSINNSDLRTPLTAHLSVKLYLGNSIYEVSNEGVHEIEAEDWELKDVVLRLDYLDEDALNLLLSNETLNFLNDIGDLSDYYLLKHGVNKLLVVNSSNGLHVVKYFEISKEYMGLSEGTPLFDATEWDNVQGTLTAYTKDGQKWGIPSEHYRVKGYD